MTREETLDAARAAVTGRGDAYGRPEDNFGLIARLWNVYWQATGRQQFEPHDIAAMMDLLKTARLAKDPTKADTWVDKAGYAACGAEIATKDTPPRRRPIEFRVGGKYRDRDGKVWTVRATDETQAYPIRATRAGGMVSWFTEEGLFLEGETHRFDLIEEAL